MIEVTNLTKQFNDVPAVDGISFSVAEGETMILLGTSGCGKTTTLKMINRLIEPTAGEIFIAGKDARKQKPELLRKHIGYVIQNIGLFPHYTVEQNVAIVPELLQWDKKWIASRVQELLDLLGLPPADFQKRYPNELSGGQQQRVGIARALAADPPVVLLDEPFGALDPITRRQILTEFKNLENLLHKTMMLVTHDVFEAIELGDRICLMDDGKVQQIGRPKELIFSPANEFVKNFFQTNRFQLELKVLTLKDILSELQPREISSEKMILFNFESSLLTVLETLEQPLLNKTILGITDNHNKMLLNVFPEDILSAFYKTKPTLAN